MQNSFSKTIDEMKEKGLFNNIPTVASPQGAYLTIDGKKYLNLCSNNYLGMASDPKIREGAINAINEYGVGTGGVWALIGHTKLHVELEKKLAEFKKADDVILVTSGYLANMAAIQTIMEKDDVIFSDELNHASIIDAVRVSGVKNKFVYKHNDVKDLSEKMEANKELIEGMKESGTLRARRVLIITDGVFSMDGDIAPLPEIVEVAKKYGAMTMVDDAHGEGVLGSHGRGIVDHYNLHGQVDIEVGTFSKAFGVMGGFIAGNAELIALYKQKARQYLFTNSLGNPETGALLAVLDILMSSDDRVKKVWANAKYLKEKLQAAGFDTGHSETPITPVMVGDENKAKEFAMTLREHGLIVTAIKFPMVALGKARLRLMPSAVHETSDLDMAVEKITLVGKQLAII